MAPVLNIKLVALCVIAPAPATTSIDPLPAPVLVVRMSAVAVKDTPLEASTLTLPLVLPISAFAVMSLATSPVAIPA